MKKNKEENLKIDDKAGLTAKSGINLDFFKLKTEKKKAVRNIDWSSYIAFIYPITIVIIVLFLVWFMNFLYNNVYLTLSQAIELSGLKAKVIEERINQPLFDQITERIDYKKTLDGRPAYACSSTPLTYGFVPACLDLPKATSTTSSAATSTKSTSTSTIK